MKEKVILVLHGSQQTGQLLLGRLDKFRKKLQKLGSYELLAIDAPFPHPRDAELRQWWERSGINNIGLEQSLQHVQNTCKKYNIVGVLGFSQGARLAHLVALCHDYNPDLYFCGLGFVIIVSGYDAPLPPELDKFAPGIVSQRSDNISLPSLHVWGTADRVVAHDDSKSLAKFYKSPAIVVHESGHHVPMQAAYTKAYLDFIKNAESGVRNTVEDNLPKTGSIDDNLTLNNSPACAQSEEPDDESLQMQLDELEALSAIFPDEFKLLSRQSDDETYQHPIKFCVRLVPSDEGFWPPKPIDICFQNTPQYPISDVPCITLLHSNNSMELASVHVQNCLDRMYSAANDESGIPCAMSCVYAARDYFDSLTAPVAATTTSSMKNGVSQQKPATPESVKVTQEYIDKCKAEGLEIANGILFSNNKNLLHGKGGSWPYTIGLIGKPSAGKSTFFNVATAFARQRNDSENVIGGATVAPHPFTTIDPNVGYCLVPAPDSAVEDVTRNSGSTHGRDAQGRRLLPVLLKDVAGLVPGAYQGRGKGNQFLNDLCDADVLIHVVDASGTSNTDGVSMINGSNSKKACNDPMNDLDWIRNELNEWVYSNLNHKWDVIKRKGRAKLQDMFSGYGQALSMTQVVLDSVEEYMAQKHDCEKALDTVYLWDEGDVYRLVSAFLGVRFPMALALNKNDLPTSAKFIDNICKALPIHGAHVGVSLSAQKEMTDMRTVLEATALNNPISPGTLTQLSTPVVWECLHRSISIQPPLIIYPISDTSTFAPLVGLSQYATLDASLPNKGMVAYIKQIGGSIPSCWNANTAQYTTDLNNNNNSKTISPLRDAIMMKPGSTVEDVFNYLRNIKALSGDFIRAEAAGNIGIPFKPIGKFQKLGNQVVIIKIMTNKRTK